MYLPSKWRFPCAVKEGTLRRDTPLLRRLLAKPSYAFIFVFSSFVKEGTLRRLILGPYLRLREFPMRSLYPKKKGKETRIQKPPLKGNSLEGILPLSFEGNSLEGKLS